MPQIYQLVGSIILAIIPAAMWGFIFYRKKPEDKKVIFLTFILGAIAVTPILLYKFMWQYFPSINAFKFAENYSDDLIGLTSLVTVPLSVLIAFMIVGIIEELMKLSAVKVIDREKIKCIDDSMEFFIIAALGFAFTENILYFYNIWESYGSDNLILPFVLRSTFSTFAHLLFSGILGYYYGTAHFAKPILQKELRKNRKHWTVILHKLFNFRKDKLFYQERMLEGVLISVGLHAIFNIFLEMNLTFMIVPFLVFGYIALNYLFKKKESHIKYDSLLQGAKNHLGKIPLPYFSTSKVKNN